MKNNSDSMHCPYCKKHFKPVDWELYAEYDIVCIICKKPILADVSIHYSYLTKGAVVSENRSDKSN